MSTPSLHIVSSQPLSAPADLHIVDSQPLPDDRSGIAKSRAFVGDTLSKTAHNMNIGNVLESLSKIDDAFKQGGIHDAIDKAREAGVRPSDFVSSLYDKIRGGDYSGAAADIIPFAFGAEGATGKATAALESSADAAQSAVASVARNAGPALKGAAGEVVAANKNPAVHMAAGAASLIPGAGHAVAAGIEGVNSAVAAVRGASKGISEQAARDAVAEMAAAREARIAAQRANPRAPLWQQQGIQAEAPVVAPPVDPIAPAPRQARPTVAPAEATPVVPAVDHALLDDLSQSLAKKPFAKLNAQEQATVKNLAARGGAPASVEAPPAAAAATAPTIPSAYREAFEGDKGGTLSPQETQARASIVNRGAPILLKAGLKPEDILTDEGKSRAVQILKESGISQNKANEYVASPQTIDALHAVMSQWDKFRDILGYKSLADFGRKK